MGQKILNDEWESMEETLHKVAMEQEVENEG
jgi:hypothetical protein